MVPAPMRVADLEEEKYCNCGALAAESLPCCQNPGSAWILRQILHDWPEKEVLRILSSVRAAMQASAQPCALCLIEVQAIAKCV